MKDSTGKDIETGQAVVVYCMSGLRRGTVARIRNARRYGRDCELVRVVFDEPEEVYKRQVRRTDTLDRWGQREYARDAEGRFIYDTVLSKTNRHKEFSTDYDVTTCGKIYILDNSAE